MSYISVDGQANNNNQSEEIGLSAVKKEHKKRQIKERTKSDINHDYDLEASFERGWINPESINVLKACDSWDIADLYSAQSQTDSFQSGEMGEDMDVLEEIALKDKGDILAWAVDLLSISPTARLMLKEAQSHDWRIGLEDLSGPDFHLDVPEKLVVLANQGLSDVALGKSSYFSNMMLIALIRALRDIWQEKRYGGFDEDFAPDAVLTLERVRAADLDVLAVMVAWELRSEGHGDLWRHMIGSDDGDLAMRFSGCLEREPASHFTHKAMRETFKQWFRSPARIDACDHETLDYLDSVIEGSLCANPFGQERLTAIVIERLSCLPDKTAYLQGQGGEILSDPLYAGMNDEINQAHLMHILHDMNVVMVQNVPFRDEALAMKIFPGGFMTPEGEGLLN